MRNGLSSCLIKNKRGITIHFKLLTIIGTRPQFIKSGVVSLSIRDHNNASAPPSVINEVIVHTGQHYDNNMSEVFFEQIQIPKPDYNLGITGRTHGEKVGRMLEGIEKVIIDEIPDMVVVYGDTDTTLAGALAATKLDIPVAHVEAGLRSYNKKMPEEVNRVLTDHVSDILFCPSENAVKNLRKEGFTNVASEGKLVDGISLPSFLRSKSQSSPLVINVGDVMYDSILHYKGRIKVSENADLIIRDVGGTFYLATVHRAENTDDPERLSGIVGALEVISERIPVVLPMHPRTLKSLHSYNIVSRKIRFVGPLSYFDMLTLLEKCKAVFTDSGGLQKEAYFYKKPCITLRNETEWIELVENDYNILVGTDQSKILKAEKDIETFSLEYSDSFYGSGDAGNKIVKILCGIFSYNTV